MKYKKSLLAAIVLVTLAASSGAAELELFGLKLVDAPADQVRSAAIAAGAEPTSTTGAVATLNATRLGLPGAQTLELTSAKSRVVVAQYFFGKHPYKTDETLRKMLVQKYGQPQRKDRLGFQQSNDFAGQYVSDGSYAWNFDRDTQLVYRKEFFGEVYLSYVNRKLLAAAEAATKAHEDLKTKSQAERSKGVF
ncbi:hypothetical protein [uncultured Ramlibacter sp.]|uniref:hypothetical protein n=1 Tax=uncultured Ramlibacter sp. TaxID=260755 RepID=UPI002630E55A|nr:hypothetical protein [uncultured Ramlibacter sp.]